jgi:hypothetical protein
MEIQELKALIKETMREVLQEERLRLCQILIPYITDDEQSELEDEFGLPLEDADNELIDMTDWVKNRNQIINTSNSDRPLGER